MFSTKEVALMESTMIVVVAMTVISAGLLVYLELQSRRKKSAPQDSGERSEKAM